MQSAAQLQARPFVAVRATPCKARRSIVITGAARAAGGAPGQNMAPHIPCPHTESSHPASLAPHHPAAAVQRSEEPQHKALTALLSLAASAALVLGAGPASADLSNVRLPPLDNGGCGLRAWAICGLQEMRFGSHCITISA